MPRRLGGIVPAGEVVDLRSRFAVGRALAEELIACGFYLDGLKALGSLGIVSHFLLRVYSY